ncbi:hypothetical protein CPB85DRAFT_1377490 [Mucidula mucida]|nr:hypothetical protein CPB85DRAFT_1377490 [Mucidula mucida]
MLRQVPARPDPPTEHSLAEARTVLTQTKQSQNALSAQISTAEEELARMLRDAEAAITVMRAQKSAYQDVINHTEAYLAPMRRVPNEILREVFYCCFEDNPLCAWVLASVSTVWRNLVLGMPRLWSKMRLQTTPSKAPETVRLWLQRSGSTVPLDIEIHLRVKQPSLDAYPSRRRSGLSSPSESLYAVPGYFAGPSTGPQYILTTHGTLPPATPFIISSPSSPDIWAPPSPPPFSGRGSRTDGNTPWGFVALYYLAEQMYRWERFVFKYDRQFSSISALKYITGPAPLLKEFDVSASEPAAYRDWSWLPMNSSPIQPAPKLESLTLQHVPFNWSASIFQNSLRKLTLRALHASSFPLNQIFYILQETAETLETASLHFMNVLNPVIPLNNLTLPHVKTLSVGGHYSLSNLVEHLVLPEVEELNFDIEARDSIEETIHTLAANTPGLSAGLKHLSIAYGHGWGLVDPPQSYYQGSVLNWHFLTDMVVLESLRIGGCHVELMLNALSHPDEEAGTGAVAINGPNNAWICPQLQTLGLRNCSGHTEAWAKIVQDTWGKVVQVIENRATASMVAGVKPVPVKALELLESQGLGIDVLGWLKKKRFSHPYIVHVS